ncbi:MAG: GxxExxY protein [Pyrinomonadaceae bacterium]|nr:GxxExxY protein [Pyrinomonadaceae bacterium]
MRTSLKHRELTGRIIKVFYDVYNELGHGFIESVYHEAFRCALEDADMESMTKVELPVRYRGRNVGRFEADLIVENRVILEFKAARALVRAHEAQMLNYLRATSIEIGILFNFGEKPEFKRMAFENTRKRSKQNLMIGSLLERD